MKNKEILTENRKVHREKTNDARRNINDGSSKMTG